MFGIVNMSEREDFAFRYIGLLLKESKLTGVDPVAAETW